MLSPCLLPVWVAQNFSSAAMLIASFLFNSGERRPANTVPWRMWCHSLPLLVTLCWTRQWNMQLCRQTASTQSTSRSRRCVSRWHGEDVSAKYASPCRAVGHSPWHCPIRGAVRLRGSIHTLKPQNSPMRVRFYKTKNRQSCRILSLA